MFKIAGDAELRMIELINASRADEDLAPLKIEVHLNKAANIQTEHMDDIDELTHIGPEGNSVVDRAEEAGFDFDGSWRIGENVGFAQNFGPMNDALLNIMHNAFMDSPGHRDNILGEDYEYIGVDIHEGLKVNANGVELPTFFFGINFARTGGEALVQEPGSNLLTYYQNGEILLDENGDAIQVLAEDSSDAGSDLSQQSNDEDGAVERSDEPVEFRAREEEADDDQDQSPSGGGCFVATAAYGDAYHPDVAALRRFRALRLRQSRLGRGFISLYWVIGPVLARYVQPDRLSGKLARRLLSPLARRLDPWGPREVHVLRSPARFERSE
ncbi:MAG: CAP domain-containing protein [Roseinatronobacter sp.]